MFTGKSSTSVSSFQLFPEVCVLPEDSSHIDDSQSLEEKNYAREKHPVSNM